MLCLQTGDNDNLFKPIQPPPEEEINGILLGFRVRYRELRYDRLRSFTVRTVNSPPGNWAELTGESQINSLKSKLVFVYLALLSTKTYSGII